MTKDSDSSDTLRIKIHIIITLTATTTIMATIEIISIMVTNKEEFRVIIFSNFDFFLI